MTASAQNALSAFKNLQQGLEELGYERLNAVADVVEKCIRSLAAQVEFYESAKAPLSTLLVDHADGGAQQITGMRMEAVSIKGTDHVIYGKPDAITALRDLLPEQCTEDDSWEIYF